MRNLILIGMADFHKEKTEKVIEGMKEFQKKHTLGGLKIRDMVEEGRRF